MKVDSDGQLFVEQVVDEADKNHNEEDTDNTNQGRMYQKKGNFSRCYATK